MKGLLIEDFRLMKVQKNISAMIMVIGIGMALFSNNTSYTIGFVSFIFSLLSVSTISYDELDNGNAFVFSLPISRKTYAVEKYCFGLIRSLGAWLAVAVLATAAGVVRGQGPVSELVITAFIVLPLVLFMMAVMI